MIMIKIRQNQAERRSGRRRGEKFVQNGGGGVSRVTKNNKE